MTQFYLKHFLLAFFLTFTFSGYTTQPLFQQNDTTLSYHFSIIDELIQKGYEANLFPGISATLFQHDSIFHFNYGLAKVETSVKTTGQIKYQLGSIGKLLTAIAVLQQVDKGLLDLHTDINKYLAASGLDFSFSDQIVTLHCLLTHSCGFNDVNIGYMAKDLESVLPLETYIKQSNPGLFQAPGIDINYSNFSYAVAGLIVEQITRKTFQDYIAEHIFKPLGMSNSSLQFPEGYEQDKDYANTYLFKEEEFQPVPIYPRHAIPAGSLVSNSEDMATFIRALFIKDTNLLSEEAWDLFYTQQMTKHPYLNGYAYGLEQQNINGLETWAKGGMLPGALSNVLIVPGEFAYFSVINTNDDRFGEYFFKSLFDRIHPNTVQSKERAPIQSIEKYTGEYRDKRYNRNAVENIISLFRGAFNVYANATNDTLVAYHNGKFHNYVPIEEKVFQNTELPYEYFVFEEDVKGKIIALYRNINIGGLSVPASYEKTRWYNSPTFINEQYPIVPLIIFSGLLFLLFSLLIRLIRIVKKDFWQNWLLPSWMILLFSSIIILILAHTYFGPFNLIKNSKDFLLGYPPTFKAARTVGYCLVILVVCYGIALLNMWRKKQGNLLTRGYLSIIGLALFLHLGFLFYWSFL